MPILLPASDPPPALRLLVQARAVVPTAPQPYTKNAVAFFAPVASLYAVRRRWRLSASIYRDGGGASCLLVAYAVGIRRAMEGHGGCHRLRLSVALLPRKRCSLSLTWFTPYAHRREVGGQHRGHVLRPNTLAATGWVCARSGGLGNAVHDCAKAGRAWPECPSTSSGHRRNVA